ncbi:MAG TPA: MBL fold metallo-hydrolase [Phycisphaerae bacterium]|nr:MBL fold metallo-hydrolase [Phycisphaerae bacterium]HPC22668.1 MBL fold metallo-hydrolase [Phycisphaerae bacterium]HRS26915.1 MBL fold metallo-hydrolase [Phycisphaerae bacterium]HRT41784.1 MBL fold metallo-hydrolase [Phycisphaerae bacterium]
MQPKPGKSARTDVRRRAVGCRLLAAPAIRQHTAPVLTCSLQSGSNGNCTYVEAGGVRLLFDAGISGRQAQQRLASNGRDIRGVHGLILSHSHSDHTRAAGIYQRLFHLPIYAAPGTQRMLAACAGPLYDVRSFEPGDTLTFGPVRVHTLPTPHDAPDSIAFVIEYAHRRLGLLTDLGHPFDGLANALSELDAVYLESNYDPHLLATGSYPAWLQARIAGPGGHLSNAEAAELLRACGRGRLQWAALAHLSEQNNEPELALETHRAILGPDFPLLVANRYRASQLLHVHAV